MHQLLYVSNCARVFPAGDLNDILQAARRNNTALGVTGLLLHIDGGFLQVLEGEEHIVNDVFARIRADRRHWNTQLLLNRTSPRDFADWSMGFEHLTGEEPETAGMFGVTSQAIAGRLSPGAGKVVATMLATFTRVQRGDEGLLRIG